MHRIHVSNVLTWGLVVATTLPAAATTLRGNVNLAGSPVGLAGVTVRLVGGSQERRTASAADGSFRFAGLAPGIYRLLPAASCAPAGARLRVGSSDLAAAPFACRRERFDDFSYASRHELAAHGWEVVDGPSGPPTDDTLYAADNVTFDATGLVLAATTDGTIAGSTMARVESSALAYRRGTWSFRVAFSDRAATVFGGQAVGDADVQTVFALNGRDDDDGYSEVDFEYLPWDAWAGGDGPRCANDRRPNLYMTTWASRVANHYACRKGPLAGRWHQLTFWVADDGTRYWLDGVEQPAHGAGTAVDAPMNISLAHWLTLVLDEEGHQLSPAPVEGLRTYRLRVDWVYLAADAFLSPRQAAAVVAAKRAAGVATTP